MAEAAKAYGIGEPLYDPPSGVEPVSAVRGTLLVLDWRWLRENGLFDGYAAALGRARGLLDVTASEWVPFPEALEHWRALDTLGLSPQREHEIGKFLGEHVHNIVLATLIRLAGNLGVSPWTALSQSHKLWLRSWRGGGMAVYRTGERSARVEISNAQVVQTHAFRNGVAGTIDAGIAPFCQKPVVTEQPEARTPTSLVLRVSWQGRGRGDPPARASDLTR
jgi:hypothetical protein